MSKKKSESKINKITVTQISSPISREDSQRKTLIGLGLNKIGRSRTFTETPDIMGMVRKVKHLLKVENS
jgi:large subunit ribosomal protein L30